METKCLPDILIYNNGGSMSSEPTHSHRFCWNFHHKLASMENFGLIGQGTVKTDLNFCGKKFGKIERWFFAIRMSRTAQLIPNTHLVDILCTKKNICCPILQPILWSYIWQFDILSTGGKKILRNGSTLFFILFVQSTWLKTPNFCCFCDPQWSL